MLNKNLLSGKVVSGSLIVTVIDQTNEKNSSSELYFAGQIVPSNSRRTYENLQVNTRYTLEFQGDAWVDWISASCSDSSVKIENTGSIRSYITFTAWGNFTITVRSDSS